MALGITIRRWHVILAAFLFLYNIHSCRNSKIKEENTTFNVIKKCIGKSPKELQKTIKNPRDAYRFVSSIYPDEDCVPVSRLYKGLLDDDDYSPKILCIQNRNFIGKYGFEFHNICTFSEDGKIGSIDNIFGYIEPQNDVNDIVRIIERKAGIKNSTYKYENSDGGIEQAMQSLHVFYPER